MRVILRLALLVLVYVSCVQSLCSYIVSKSRCHCLGVTHSMKSKPAFEVWYDDQVPAQVETNSSSGNKQHADVKSSISATLPVYDGQTKNDNKYGVRINKCFKNMLSRREADRYLREGRVKLNRKIASEGCRVKLGDVITLDGKKVLWESIPGLKEEALDQHMQSSSSMVASASDSQFVYVKYWKPIGVTCTTDRNDVTNIIDASGVELAYRGQRLFPVGRLDKDSTGIILLTSNGKLPESALRPEMQKEKVYHVILERRISDITLDKIRKGVVISSPVQHSGRVQTARTLPCTVTRDLGGDGCSFQISLKEGRNRQIRRMCESLGHKVTSLHRVSFMGITLSGLKEGYRKELNKKEMKIVKNALGENQKV